MKKLLSILSLSLLAVSCVPKQKVDMTNLSLDIMKAKTEYLELISDHEFSVDILNLPKEIKKVDVVVDEIHAPALKSVAKNEVNVRNNAIVFELEAKDLISPKTNYIILNMYESTEPGVEPTYTMPVPVNVATNYLEPQESKIEVCAELEFAELGKYYKSYKSLTYARNAGAKEVDYKYCPTDELPARTSYTESMKPE
jgi:hypothetical protein